jgi:drug/metabolite transporter (DMT)-like permease
LVQTTSTTTPQYRSNGARSGGGGSAAGARSAVRGIVYANAAVFTFTLMDGFIKEISDVFPTGQIIFFRNLLAFIPLMLFAWWRYGGITVRTSQPWSHVVRGVFGVTSMFFFFLSYKLMDLSEAIALGLSGPIFITVLSVPLLGEHVGWRRWSAVVVGFIGVLVMTHPGAGVFDWNALVPLAAAVFYAVAMISIRKLGSTEPPTTIVFHFTTFATLASLLTIPVGIAYPEQAWVMPSGLAMGAIILTIGVLGGAAQIVLTMAYQHARAAVVAPFDYTALIYGFLIGAVWFKERPDAYIIVGGAIVVAAGIYIIHRETVVARNQHREPPAPPLPTNE